MWDKKELGRSYFESAYEPAQLYPGNIPVLTYEEREAIDRCYGFDGMRSRNPPGDGGRNLTFS